MRRTIGRPLGRMRLRVMLNRLLQRAHSMFCASPPRGPGRKMKQPQSGQLSLSGKKTSVIRQCSAALYRCRRVSGRLGLPSSRNGRVLLCSTSALIHHLIENLQEAVCSLVEAGSRPAFDARMPVGVRVGPFRDRGPYSIWPEMAAVASATACRLHRRGRTCRRGQTSIAGQRKLMRFPAFG